MSLILKEGHSLKGKDLVPLIERVKQLPTGTELARLTLTRPIKDLTFDGLREEFRKLTEKSMDEILVRAGLPRDINNGRAVLHHAIVLANEVGEPSAQDEDQTLPKSAAVHRPTKRHSDQAHETSSKYPKCDGQQWFESHRQMSKWLIHHNRCVLVNNGVFSGIRDNLLQAGILTAHEVEEIEEDKIRHKQMRRLVDKLCQKSDEVIEKCCEVIREADRILYDQLQWPCPPIPDEVHKTDIDGQMSDDLCKIQQELKSWYTTQLSHFHPIPWCDWLEMDFDHVYTNLKMVKGLKHRLSSRFGPKPPSDIDDTKGLLELLFSHEGRAVTFIQGSAGSGKSTLCRRLAYLWAAKNSCIHGRHFDLVLLVEARSIDEDNLKQSIMRQLFPEDYDMTEEAVYKCITKCGKNALLIIDGVDELRQKGKMAVQKLLEGRFLRSANIILTGRPESVEGFIKYASVHLEVRGFTRKNIKSYICKYFPQRHKELEPAVVASLCFLTPDLFYYRDDDDDDLGDLCVSPFTTCLMCLLVEEKGGDIPSDENDILEEVIMLTLDRYVSKQSVRSQGVTTEELLSQASEVAWIGFNGRKLHFTEKFIKERFTGGMGEHLLKSGLMNRDFTMSRYHTSRYCYFPHRSIQDYLCAKYLVSIPQTSLDEILMDLPLEVFGWWIDMVIKLFYQLKGEKERLRRSVLCILDKCPVYRKLKPGFQKYVGRLTHEKRLKKSQVIYYERMVVLLLGTSAGNMVLTILSASDEMLRISYHVVSHTLAGKCQRLLAIPVLCHIFVEQIDAEPDKCDLDSYAYYHCDSNYFFTGDVKIIPRCVVVHKMSHVYVSNTFRQWCHFDSFRNIANCYQIECSKLPLVLSVLVLPGFIDVLYVKEAIDTLNCANRKLTLFLIVPQLQCEDLSRMRLLSMIRSEVSPDIQVCYEYPKFPVTFGDFDLRPWIEGFKNGYSSTCGAYSNPVAVHHRYYNKYCPF